MQRLIMLILLPISAVLTACAQNSLTMTCNALQEGSLVRRTYSLCEQGFEGENIVWDFRMLNETPCKSHLQTKYRLQKILIPKIFGQIN